MTEEDDAIIIPPPDIKIAADLAAESVAKVGPAFENRIREKEQHNPKFCFLNPNDPYYKYFQNRIAQAREAPKEKVQKPVVQPRPEMVKPPPIPPPAFEFTLNLPTVNKQDLDIMKLSAQFVAKNGPSFLNSLSQKEQNNSQFDFLRPSHSLYSTFIRLVEMYTKVITTTAQRMVALKHDSLDISRVLDRINKRVEFDAYILNEKQIKYQKEQDEKLAFATIDWHDFVVVETIEFVEADDRAVLPVPLVLSELESMTLAERKNLLQFENPKFVADNPQDMEVDMEVSDEEESNSTPVGPVQPNNIPKVRGAPEQEQICPRCNQSVKVSEMSEHIRIELHDPQYRDQALKALQKEQPTNLVDDNALAANLKRMTQFRSDIFGQAQSSIDSKIQFENEKAKEIRDKKVIWDGHKASVPAAMNKAKALAAKPPPPPTGLPKPAIPKPQPPPPGENTSNKKQKLDNSMSVTINGPDGPMSFSDLTLLWSVSALKDRISKTCGMPAGKQKLSKGDTVLKNKETLLEAGVVDGCVLTLELKARGGKK